MTVIILWAVGVYLGLGVLFGVGFVARGAGIMDPVAAASPLRVRLLWLPGAAALWPALLARWLNARGRRP